LKANRASIWEVELPGESRLSRRGGAKFCHTIATRATDQEIAAAATRRVTTGAA
jgi:hypothetical protein